MNFYSSLKEVVLEHKRFLDRVRDMQMQSGSMLAELTKKALDPEKLVGESLKDITSSYRSAIEAVKAPLHQYHELKIRSPALDFIQEANLALAENLSMQRDLSQLVRESLVPSRYWQSEIESYRHLADDVSAAKLALQSHCSGLAQISLLAQQRSIQVPWDQIGAATSLKVADFEEAVHSFTVLTDSYRRLIRSFEESKQFLAYFPPFFSNVPPVEIYSSADLLDSLSRTEAERAQRLEETAEIDFEVRRDIELSTEKLLDWVDPGIRTLWLGAREALDSDNPDRSRHVVVSLREMVTHILHAIAPDSEVQDWTSDQSHFHEGRPTRRARLLFVCRDLSHGPFVKFVENDVSANITFINLFQRGTHELDLGFTEQQLRALVLRTESLVRFLLLIWRSQS